MKTNSATETSLHIPGKSRLLVSGVCRRKGETQIISALHFASRYITVSHASADTAYYARNSPKPVNGQETERVKRSESLQPPRSFNKMKVIRNDRR
jgi:hypothetical protein